MGVGREEGKIYRIKETWGIPEIMCGSCLNPDLHRFNYETFMRQENYNINYIVGDIKEIIF